MKKIFLYIVLIVFISFLIPIVLVKRFETIETLSNTNEEVKVEQNYEYSECGTVKILHVKTDEIEEMPIDEYLLGVVSAEMPAQYEEEALKAQAVVARTYVVYTIKNNADKHADADLCDDFKCCQAWISKDDRMARWEDDEKDVNWSKIEDSVYSTKGQIIVYDNEPINAFFHSNSGGRTEEVSNVWGGRDLPYLKTVETSGEDAYDQYASEISLSKSEFEEKIKQFHSDFIIDYNDENCIKVNELTEGGRVKSIQIGNLNLSGVEVRTIFGLKSANFDTYINDDTISFQVRGYGHGVGMSQTGANSLAKEGKNYIDIVKHFYTGVEIINI